MIAWKTVARLFLPRSLRLSVFCPELIRKRVLARTGMRVASGPFKGMCYLGDSVGSVLEPKLLGIYERELHGIVEELVEYGGDTVIDIGAAEGYYAVGLALRLPNARIIAFETEAEGRNLLMQLARINEVAERIHCFGCCNASDLSEALKGGGKTVIVCDVEGAESLLLNPVEIPALGETAILVELHPKKSPGVKELLRARFELSHEMSAILQEPRCSRDFPYKTFPINLFPLVYIENAVSEFRQPWEDIMEWYWMVPKRNV